MKLNVAQWVQRLETLSMRERLMVVLGLPLAVVLIGEFVISDPAVARAAAATKQGEVQQVELKALSSALAALPAIAPLPGADQLAAQRDALQRQIDAASAVVAGVEQVVDWGTVVRATVAGTAGLTLTKLKTLPAELVFSPSMAQPASALTGGRAVAPARAAPAASGVPTATAAATAALAASAAPAAAPIAPTGPDVSIYRHRAELTVNGNFATLLGYLQTLQRVPGGLRWDSMKLSVQAYPQASMQLTLHTLSNRSATPFN